MPEGEHPKIMIGGGGRKMLRLAAQYADVVGIVPRWRGSWSKVVQDQTFDGVKQKIDRVKNTAEDFGRDPDGIEFQVFIQWTEITDTLESIIENLANDLGVATEDVENSEIVMVGSSSDIRDKIQRFHEETGANYFVFYLRSDQFEEYAESIVHSLTS